MKISFETEAVNKIRFSVVYSDKKIPDHIDRVVSRVLDRMFLTLPWATSLGQVVLRFYYNIHPIGFYRPPQ